MDLDKKFLDLKEGKFDKEKCVIDMYEKHSKKKCNCHKKNKKCIGYIEKNFVLDFQQLNDKNYVKKHYNHLESLYHVFMSITQSLRCKSRKRL